MRRRGRWTLVIGALALAASVSSSAWARPEDQVVSLLESMTPEERVGQLFLVTFRGTSAGVDSDIADLIQNYHVSGVVLRSRGANFVEGPGSAESARALIAALQQIEDQAAHPEEVATPTGETPSPPQYVPLLIGIGQGGGEHSLAEVMPGLSSMASEMAIGATWDTQLARDAGEVLGRDLEGVGFNLLLGPSLDVLEDPRLGGGGDLGVSTFGGDPFWVSAMGQAFIEGLHAGSSNRLAVVAKHFPGLGSSDRPLDEEVATVRKSLDQLRTIELAPFFAVTRTAPGTDPGTVDGLLTSHIRYQGLQGNIRATTRPVSLDPQALSQILALEPLASWRLAGGVTVSDSLGSRAIRLFRDPRELAFEGHLIARDAFLAGNDLLLLADFQATNDPDEMTTIRSTLTFFAQKYQEDEVFAQRVDEAVIRILRMKERLYPGGLDLTEVVPDAAKLEAVGAGSAVGFQVARAAATLLSPAGGTAEEIIGGPPEIGDRVVFFTDVRTRALCPTCPVHTALDPRALEATILRLYGPRAAGQVASWHLVSYTMADLAAYLDEPPPVSGLSLANREELDQALQGAEWLVFSILDATDEVYGSNALKLLLDRRPDLARAKRVAAFALDVPYDLDATDVSAIDLYYGLYAKSTPFIDVAARLLFQELGTTGAPPVSVPGVGYDLIEAMQPDPDQVITLLTPSLETSLNSPTPGPAGFQVGDTIQLETGVIVDGNGHPVPDGTPVDFLLQYQDIPQETLQTSTIGGVAKTAVTLDRLGRLQILAESGSARSSEILELNVQEGIPAFVTVIAPTAEPSIAPDPTGTVRGPTPTAESGPGAGTPGTGGTPGWGGLLVGLLESAGAGAAAFTLALRYGLKREESTRWGLAALVGGLAGLNYLVLGFPGSSLFVAELGIVATLVGVAAGAMAGAAVMLWRRGQGG
ncbi:MAG: glycoside hydrolase family 3 N-terminal domain-containing protein, partial [Anaerolineales bacterium]